MKQLAQAIISVMQDVKGIEKSMTIGSGSNSYKGVPDQEVKKIIGESMAKHGLCMLPIETTAQTKIERWDETYNGVTKVRQSVFTEAQTKYLLLHTSGESQVISGYGHGIDSQDKGAGKATTYALKYALLYTFLVPTGKIDDADSTHSNDMPIKKLSLTDAAFQKALDRITTGEQGVIEKLEAAFTLTADQRKQLTKILA